MAYHNLDLILRDQSYINGHTFSEDDVKTYKEVVSESAFLFTHFPNFLRWLNHIKSLLEESGIVICIPKSRLSESESTPVAHSLKEKGNNDKSNLNIKKVEKEKVKY